MLMGYELLEAEYSRDRHGEPIESDMVYLWHEDFKKPSRSGWEVAMSRETGHNLSVGQAATEYIHEALVNAGTLTAKEVGGQTVYVNADGRIPDSFQQTLGVVSRSGFVTDKTCNFVAGAASRHFKEIQKAARDEANRDDLEAFPILGKWNEVFTGQRVADGGTVVEPLMATVGDKRAFEGNYGPSNVLTLIVDNQYRIKAFSNAKPVREAKIGDTVEIVSFIPTKVDEWKGQESLTVRSLKIKAVEQEDFNAVMFGLPLLLDPTLTTLALCVVGTVLMGWKATCNYVTTRYRDKFTGDGIEQIPSGYILKGQKQGLPEDEWGR